MFRKNNQKGDKTDTQCCETNLLYTYRKITNKIKHILFAQSNKVKPMKYNNIVY